MRASARRLVAVPAQPDLSHIDHPGGRPDHRLGLVDQVRVDGVHQPPVDLAGGIAQDEQDGHGDEQADDRVGDRVSGPGSGGAEDHREAGEPVGAGVQPVGDQRGGSDPASGADPVLGDHLVTEEADHTGDGEHRRGAGPHRGS